MQLNQRILSGRYQLLEVVGQGGMATVYKAKDLTLNRTVAVKILNPELTHEEEFIQRFIWEAKATGRLSHENIVSVYDIKNENQTYFMVMEFVDGITLKELIQREGKLPVEKVISIGIQICDALAHAHQQGIIHRDIKPQNIICTTDQQYRITDFGISRFIKDSSKLTKTGNVVGSVYYFSPEQAQGKSVDITSDLYSFGVVLYEMVTGQPPYDAPEKVAIALKHIHDEIPNPKELNPDLPEALAQLIKKAMAKQPQDRFRSAIEMKKELEQIKASLQSTQPTTTVSTPKTPTPEKTQTTHHRAKIIWGITTVASVVLFSLFYAFYAEAKFFSKPTTTPTEKKEEQKTVTKPTSVKNQPSTALNKQPQQPKKAKPKPKKPKHEKHSTKPKDYIIVVGSFQQKENAKRLLTKLKENGFKASIRESTVFGNTLYRVIGGEFHTHHEAEKELNKIKHSGIEGTNEAVIVDLTKTKKHK